MITKGRPSIAIEQYYKQIHVQALNYVITNMHHTNINTSVHRDTIHSPQIYKFSPRNIKHPSKWGNTHEARITRLKISQYTVNPRILKYNARARAYNSEIEERKREKESKGEGGNGSRPRGARGPTA